MASDCGSPTSTLLNRLDTLLDANAIGLRELPSSPGTEQPTVSFIPIAPQAYNRYDRRQYIKRIPGDHIVPPLSRGLHRNPLVHWITREHPEGALYFRHCEKSIYTDVNLYSPKDRSLFAFCVQEILTTTKADWLLRSGNNINLILDIQKHDKVKKTIECAYYFVDHTERLIFWMDPFAMGELDHWKRVPGMTTRTHIKKALELEYWRHIEYFPSTLLTSPGIVKELKDRIIFSLTDILTSSTSTSFLSTDNLIQQLAIVDALKANTEQATRQEASYSNVIVDSTWGIVIGRLMKELVREKFINCNGEFCARLDSMNSVYGVTENAPSSRFAFMAGILFKIPHAHLRTLNAMYRDRLLNPRSWKEFIHRLRSEWQETVLFGTLILNANVGFLAISSGNLDLAPLPRALSYISVLFGLGSVLTAICLSRQYGQQDRDNIVVDMMGPAGFFARRSIVGLESLAVLYALPYGFMIWGMITFLIAFLVMAMQSISGGFLWALIAIFAVIFATASGHLIGEEMIRSWRKWRKWIFSFKAKSDEILPVTV
ncbi:hypothetical protein R3P38DRAFT_2844596 [Favolaschia claudopus]|uniref:Uncharacterized protein n=1 Tax=Favolaschia claudopus TaxID=2862362 RepID=A0AAW0E376_9AGAR